jgi:predicted nucleic acid-binding protein
MTELVLDASVFVAAISPSEVHHRAARALYASSRDDQAFVVPSLFRVEVLAALARRDEPAEVLDLVEVLVTGPRFHSVAIDEALVDEAARVVRAARVRAYDALYAALALSRSAALLTLDVELRSKISAAFPQLSLPLPAE